MSLFRYDLEKLLLIGEVGDASSSSRIFTKLVITLLFSVLFIFLSASNAFGKCKPIDFKTAHRNAAAVFVGTVVDIKTEGKKKHFEFLVEKYWKGIKTKTVVVSVQESFRYSANYKYQEKYLVFAKLSEESGELFDTRCSRSSPVSKEFGFYKYDIVKLGVAKSAKDLKEGKRLNS